MAVGPPQVITKMLDGKKCEPYEEAHVEVPQEHMGQVHLFPRLVSSAALCVWALGLTGFADQQTCWDGPQQCGTCGARQVVDLLGQRKGQMLDMGAAVGEGTTQRVKYRIPTRGLLVLSCCMKPLTACVGSRQTAETVYHSASLAWRAL